MAYSIGDGIVVTALTAGVVGYLYLRSQDRRRRLEVVHAERLAAMDKGIPLPELPLDPLVREPRPDPGAPLIIGIVLAAFGLGSMAALSLVDNFRQAWPMPLPVAFMGAGLTLYYYLTGGGQDSKPTEPRGQ
ncbi:MAG: hypothetical protein Q8N52_08900 [Acidobacteriota bacterium]|nr:hypothetical protein [Acidobacteriota bacterium]MDP2390428.1 hypothetical protein [Acidobacteriota bacterium]